MNSKTCAIFFRFLPRKLSIHQCFLCISAAVSPSRAEFYTRQSDADLCDYDEPWFASSDFNGKTTHSVLGNQVNDS